MKTLFTFIFSLLFVAVNFAQITITNDSLLAYYSFDSDGNNQYDNRFHLSTVTNAGSAVPTYDTGKKGNAVRFNKNNALVNSSELANHIAASTNKSFSLSLWVNYGGTNTSLSTFVEMFESLFMRNSNLSFGMLGSNNVWATDNANGGLSGSGWRHIVAIYNAQGSALQIYLDGNFVRQVAVNGTYMLQTTPNFVVGTGTNTANNVSNYNWASKGFEGAIDEMYLYNRILSANEVSDLFNLRVTPASSVSGEKLIAHYDFENTSNNTHANTHHLIATMPASNMAAPAFIAGGKVGNAVSFNGSNALWNQTEFGTSWAGSDKNLTISTWIRHANNNTAQYFTMFELFESLFVRTNVSLGISRANAVFNATGGGVTIPANAWTHVTAIYDQQANQARLYINGDLRGTLTSITGFHAYNSTLILGAGTNSSVPNFAGKGFVGDIDEMYIFNRVLTAAEIYGMVNLAPVETTPKYPVTFSASAGGTLTATVDGVAINSGDMVEEGKTIVFTSTPDAGMQIGSWFNNGAFLQFRGTVPTVHSVVHGAPGTNRTVTFVPQTFTVDFISNNQYGTIVAFKLNGETQEQINSGSTVPNGTIVRFVAAPINNGYKANNWWLDNIYSPSLDNQEIVTLTIRNNTSIAVDFGRDQNMAQINFNAGSNGTITAYYIDNRAFAPSALGKAKSDYPVLQSGDFVPKSGTRINFVATPNQGYKTNSWSVNNSLIQFEGVGGNVQVPNTYDLYNPTDDVNLSVSFVVAETSVRNASFETLTLYPNPAHDMVRIVAESNIDRVEIYSLSGTLQQTETVFGVRNMNIQLGNLNEGMYLLKIFTDEGIKTAKLQIKR